MGSLSVQLGPPSYRPHVKLTREKLQSLQLGNGRSALIRLSATSAEPSTSTSTATANATWICSPVWQIDEDDEASEVPPRGSRAGTPRRNITPAPASNPDAIVVSANLIPSSNAGASYHGEVFAVAAGDVAAANEVAIKVLDIQDVALDGEEGQVSESQAQRSSLDHSTRQLVGILAKELLLELGTVMASQTFAVIHQGLRITLQVNPDASAPATLEEAQAALLSLSRQTSVTIARQKKQRAQHTTASAPVASLPTPTPSLNPKLNLGGLDEEVKLMRELVFLPLMRPDLFEQHNLQPPRGVLLHGPPGTGKTSLSLSVASSFLTPSQIFTISGPELSSSYHGRTESRLRKVFQQARKQEKAVIIIDEIDVIAASRDGGEGNSVGSRVVATLLTEIDGVGHEYKSQKGKRKGRESESEEEEDAESQAPSRSPGRVVVIAATNRPNVIDPALRRPGRLDREIEIGVPSPVARLDILSRLLRNTPNNLTKEDLEYVATRTHGFVGADLSALVREAGMRVIRRQMTAEGDGSPEAALTHATESLTLGSSTSSLLSADDLLAALPLMRPSSLRSLIPPPPLSWSSIGLGSPDSPYSAIKRSIQQTIEWPLRYPDRMRRLGISGNRGVLLYGPPGCSKTMIARACAQSEGINWIGVKGPELYSKYLGDSEKGIRELFRKARAAAPTIVFFDEIDALTTTRSSGASGDGDGNAVSDRVIATLLTELDGADALEKVVVIAATNRPQVIDPALLRPGRLDTLLYVGPPDVSARHSILELRTANMSTADDLNLDQLAQMTDGCSGAEIVSICQDAGIRAMTESLEAEQVRQVHFEEAARAIRRRITPEIVRQYESWRDQRL